MRWLTALLGVVMAGGGGYMSYFMFLHNKPALTYIGIMLVIVLSGLLLFSRVLTDERSNKAIGVMGLAAASAAIFGIYSLWPMVVMNYTLLGRMAVLVVITLVGLGLLYYAVRNGKKK